MSTAHLDPNKLLAELTVGDRRSVLRDAREIRLPVGRVRIDNRHSVYFIRSGVVSLLLSTHDGKSAEIGLVGNEGCIYWTDVPGTSQLQAIVVVPGTALKVPADHMRLLMGSSVSLFRHLSTFHRTATGKVAQLLVCSLHHDLEPRLCRWILDVIDHGGGKRISVTQELLSQLMGVHRASLHVVITRLRQAGAIDISRSGGLEVVDIEKVRSISCGCER